jgi:hypothetical protein
VAQAGFVHRVAGVLVGRRVQRVQRARHAGIAPQHEVVDARVLEAFHRQALQRAQVVGHLRPAPAAVASQVGQHGAVALHGGGAGLVVQHLGQAQAIGLAVGHGDGGQIHLIRRPHRVGHEGCGLVPQAAQCEFQPPLHIHEQGAVAVALQQGAAVGCGELEEIDLPLRVAAVQAHAFHHPLPQTLQRHLAHEGRRLLQKGLQAWAGLGGVAAVDADAGALHQLHHQREIAAQQLGRPQPPRHRAQALV